MKARKRPKKLKHRQGLTTTAIAAAVICLAAAGMTAAKASAPPPAAVQPLSIVEDDSVLIPTPARTLAKGEKLSSVELAEIRWPKSRLTGQYVASKLDLTDAYTLTPLPKLLPIPVSAISKQPVDSNTLVEGIPEGMRAITIKVDAEAAVEGWASPGNYVDVIVIRVGKDSDIGLEAKIIAENVKILSAGRSAAQAGGSDTAPHAPTTVTLLVNQEDALKIKTAANVGKLNFSLRGAGDGLPASALAMNQKKLLGGASPLPKKADSAKGFARGPDGKEYVLDNASRWTKLNAEAPAAVGRLP